jgi:transposase
MSRLLQQRLILSADEIQILKRLAINSSSHNVGSRARALLLLGEGHSAEVVAVRVGFSVRTIFSWRKRFCSCLAGTIEERLSDAPRTGRPKAISTLVDPLILEIVEDWKRFRPRSPKQLTKGEVQIILSFVFEVDVSIRAIECSLRRLGVVLKAC